MVVSKNHHGCVGWVRRRALRPFFFLFFWSIGGTLSPGAGGDLNPQDNTIRQSTHVLTLCILTSFFLGLGFSEPLLLGGRMSGLLGKSRGHISHSQWPLPSREVGDCHYSVLWFECVSQSPLVPTVMVLAGQEDTCREGPHTLEFGIPSTTVG